jgi:ATPase family associated with various cellular activities (AAA)
MSSVEADSFYGRLASVLNSEQSRSVILCGNVYDLFPTGNDYLPLVPLLIEKTKADGLIRVVYEQNGPIRILDARDKVKNAWISWKAGIDLDTLLVKGLRERGPSEIDRLGAEFDQLLLDAIGNPTLALEVCRQLTICSRSALSGSLIILIEAADMLLPAGNGDVANLDDSKLRRIAICQDWFGEPSFMRGGDSVILIAESRSLIHPRISRLPQVLSVEIPSPDTVARRKFTDHFLSQQNPPPKLWAGAQELAEATAGLSLHALRQLLAGASFSSQPLQPKDLVNKVEEYIQAQVGEDVVEFKKPSHGLADVVGCTKLKEFLRTEMIPRFRTADAEKALPGAAVAGPIGGGKTFLFEAVAGELGIPVLVLKNIRSQWYGQTDVIFERLRRVLEALDRVVIFVDEADTQFGGVGEESHSTERRLTGKIQAMMSDPKLRGKVMWLLMTARIHLLSPDIRRPGRVGDLILPVLDPEADDRVAFIKWMISPVTKQPSDADIKRIDELTTGYSAAAFSSLRTQLKAMEAKSLDEAVAIIHDQLPPAIGLTRRYQILQAMLNCTRRSLLPNPNITEKDRQAWEIEIRQLETMGVN